MCPAWDPLCTPWHCSWDGLPSPGWVRRGLPGGMVITAQQSPAGRDHSATKCCHLLRALARICRGCGGARGPGPGVQLRGGQGAEKAQAGRAARVGCIWVGSMKGQHGVPLPLPCSHWPLGRVSLPAEPPLCADKLNTGQLTSSPCPHTHGHTMTSAAPRPPKGPCAWFSQHLAPVPHFPGSLESCTGLTGIEVIWP